MRGSGGDRGVVHRGAWWRAAVLFASFGLGLAVKWLLDSGSATLAAIAAVACIVGGAVGTRGISGAIFPECAFARRPSRGGADVVALLPAVGLAIPTVVVVAKGTARSQVELLLWGASFLALVGAMVLSSRRKAPGTAAEAGQVDASGIARPRGLTRRYGEFVLVALVLLLGAGVRLCDLERYPLVVHNDEASCGIMARQVIEEWRGEGVAWLAPREFYGFPTLGFVPSAVGQVVAPPNLRGHRLANALASVAALICLYLLLRDTVGPAAALTGLWLASVGHFSVHFSRSGIHSGHAGYLTIACGWFLWWGFRTGRRRWFVAAGLALAACGLTYHAALAVPLWLGSVVGVAWVASAPFRRHFTARVVLTAVTALVTLAPMVGSWVRFPGTFVARRGSLVFTSDPESIRHMRSVYGEDYLGAVLRSNLARALRLFTTEGDSNLQYGWRGGGLLDRASSAFLMAGLGVGLASLRRRQVWPVLAGLGVTWFVGAVLTMDAVQYSRVAGLMLLVCVPQAWFAAALLAAADGGFARFGRWMTGASLAVVLAAIGGVNLHLYFVRHDRASDPVEVIRTVVARDARDDGPATVTFVSCPALPCDLGHKTHEFLAEGRRVEALADIGDLARPDGSEIDRLVVVVPHGDAVTTRAVCERFPDASLEPRRVVGYSSEPIFDRLVIPVDPSIEPGPNRSPAAEPR